MLRTSQMYITSRRISRFVTWHKYTTACNDKAQTILNGLRDRFGFGSEFVPKIPAYPRVAFHFIKSEAPPKSKQAKEERKYYYHFNPFRFFRISLILNNIQNMINLKFYFHIYF